MCLAAIGATLIGPGAAGAYHQMQLVGGVHYEKPTAATALATYTYAVLDGMWYQILQNNPPTLSYESVGSGDFAWYTLNGVMQSCSSTIPYSDSKSFFVFSLSEPAIPLASSSFQTFSNAYGTASVLFMTTTSGVATCQGATATPPAPYDVIFQDAFEL